MYRAAILKETYRHGMQKGKEKSGKKGREK
jgi:hypothetical protein